MIAVLAECENKSAVQYGKPLQSELPVGPKRHHHNPARLIAHLDNDQKLHPLPTIHFCSVTSRSLCLLSGSIQEIVNSYRPASKLPCWLNLEQLLESRPLNPSKVQLPADPEMSWAYSALSSRNGAHWIIVLTQISLHIPDSVNSKVKDTCR